MELIGLNRIIYFIDRLLDDKKLTNNEISNLGIPNNYFSKNSLYISNYISNNNAKKDTAIGNTASFTSSNKNNIIEVKYLLKNLL
jgi:hypothetical protein